MPGAGPNQGDVVPARPVRRPEPRPGGGRGAVFFRRAISLGRIRGIRIGLDYSWFIVFVLLTWTLAVAYYPAEFPAWQTGWYWAMGAITAVLLFASVLLHELGHSLVAQQYDIPVRSITLFIFGGVAQITAEPPRPRAEFLIAIAGPAVSLVLAVVFGALSFTLPAFSPLGALVRYLALMNAALLIFNLIPGFPLDGGRVLRSIIWAVNHNLRRATVIAASIGRAFAMLLVIVGIWQVFTGNVGGGLWIALIGWFMESAAAAQVRQVASQRALAGHKVVEAMDSSCPSVPATISLRELVDRYVLGANQQCFTVKSDDAVLGLVTVNRIRQVPRSAWEVTTAAQAMLPLDKLRRIGPDDELWTALEEMDRAGVSQLAVMSDGRLLGTLSRDGVIARLRVLQELATAQ